MWGANAARARSIIAPSLTCTNVCPDRITNGAGITHTHREPYGASSSQSGYGHISHFRRRSPPRRRIRCREAGRYKQKCRPLNARLGPRGKICRQGRALLEQHRYMCPSGTATGANCRSCVGTCAAPLEPREGFLPLSRLQGGRAQGTKEPSPRAAPRSLHLDLGAVKRREVTTAPRVVQLPIVQPLRGLSAPQKTTAAGHHRELKRNARVGIVIRHHHALAQRAPLLQERLNRWALS